MRNSARLVVLPPSGGRLLRQVSTSQFRFTLGAHAGGSALPPHVHEDHPGIVFVAGGGVEEAYPAETVVAGEGVLMLKRHDLRHANRFGPDGAVLLIVEQLEPAPFLNALPQRPSLRQGPFTRMIGGLLVRELIESPDACEIGLTSFAVDLWGVATAQRRSARSRTVGRAVQLIHDDIGRVRRIDDLARSAGGHPVYLARAFRAQFGCSLQTYVTRVRLERAVELIRRTRRGLADIAAEAGFADQAHMTRVFRSYLGRTPGVFRAR